MTTTANTAATVDTAAEITRENALDMLDALGQEEQGLRAALDAADDPAQRAGILRRAACNQQRRALACERRPGRARDKNPSAQRCRDEAHLLTGAADIEQLRADAAGRGRPLPDPLPLLRHIDMRVGGSDEALETLLALYTAAA